MGLMSALVMRNHKQTFRTTRSQADLLSLRASERGFSSVSEYLHYVVVCTNAMDSSEWFLTKNLFNYANKRSGGV